MNNTNSLDNLQDIQIRAMDVVDSSIVISDMTHPDKPVIYANAAFKELTGYTSSEILGKNCKFLQNNDTSQLEEVTKIKEAFKNKVKCEVTLRNYKKNGTLFYNKLMLSPILNKENELTHYIGVQNDITEYIEKTAFEKRTLQKNKLEKNKLSTTNQNLVKSNIELSLQKSKTKIAELQARSNFELLNRVVQNFPNGFVLVANESFYIEYIGGLELDHNFKDYDISKKIHIDDVPTLKPSQKETLKVRITQTINGVPSNQEVPYLDDMYSVNTAPLPNSLGHTKKAILVYTKITEQKKLSNEIKEALNYQKELNKLKSRFITTASHEFRTPLSAINLSAVLIEKLNTEDHSQKRIKQVNRIKNNVQNLVVILDDLLSLSSISEGKTKPNFKRFNIILFLKSCLEELQDTKKTGQTFELQNKTNEEFVLLDEKLLRHVIQNLLTNAIKYSSEKKPIILTATKENNLLTISIKDLGIGIPENEQQHLFKRFFRAANTSYIEGTGLGLNIAKQHTELMGGEINFKSIANKGTTFCVNFPKAYLL